MEPSFWLERWGHNQIGFHQSHINPYLVTHWGKLDIDRSANVFVPLCGKSFDMVWLREQGHGVFGIDIAPIAVRDFFIERDLQPTARREEHLERWEAGGYTLWCGDLFELSASQLIEIGAVFDRASLIALPIHRRRSYVRHMSEIIPTRAPTLLISLTYPQAQSKGPPFSVEESEIRELYCDYSVDKLADVDVLSLPENARFVERGITKMSEQVYRLMRS